MKPVTYMNWEESKNHLNESQSIGKDPSARRTSCLAEGLYLFVVDDLAWLCAARNQDHVLKIRVEDTDAFRASFKFSFHRRDIDRFEFDSASVVYRLLLLFLSTFFSDMACGSY